MMIAAGRRVAHRWQMDRGSGSTPAACAPAHALLAAALCESQGTARSKAQPVKEAVLVGLLFVGPLASSCGAGTLHTHTYTPHTTETRHARNDGLVGDPRCRQVQSRGAHAKTCVVVVGNVCACSVAPPGGTMAVSCLARDRNLQTAQQHTSRRRSHQPNTCCPTLKKAFVHCVGLWSTTPLGACLLRAGCRSTRRSVASSPVGSLPHPVRVRRNASLTVSAGASPAATAHWGGAGGGARRGVSPCRSL